MSSYSNREAGIEMPEFAHIPSKKESVLIRMSALFSFFPHAICFIWITGSVIYELVNNRVLESQSDT